jgi:hypothetical protein
VPQYLFETFADYIVLNVLIKNESVNQKDQQKENANTRDEHLIISLRLI